MTAYQLQPSPCSRVKPFITETPEIGTLLMLTWFPVPICIFYIMKRPLECEHLLMWTLFPSYIWNLYIMKRPLRCEHLLMWQYIPGPMCIFYILKIPQGYEHLLMWTLYLYLFWYVNTISRSLWYLLNYKKNLWCGHYLLFPFPSCILWK